MCLLQSCLTARRRSGGRRSFPRTHRARHRMRRVFRHVHRASLRAFVAGVALTCAASASRAEELPPSSAVAPAAAPADSAASIDLEVVDDANGAPVAFANLVLLDSRRGFLGT